MKTEIYYFSGTGNSLAAARAIAAKTGAILISIPAVMDRESIMTAAGQIGLVFPSYLAQCFGVPLIVERFIKKLEDIGAKRIFAVCTCGGYELVNALPSLKSLARLIKGAGGRLWATYSVRLPMNNLDYDHIPVPIERDSGIIVERANTKIAAICSAIRKGKRERFRHAKSCFNQLMTPLYRLTREAIRKKLIAYAHEPDDTRLTLRELIPLSDKSIRVDGNCTGCGICAKICPVHNIELRDGRPAWLHHCEMCFACDEWCPAGAIHHWGRAEGIKYRHPEVKIADMFGCG